MVSNHHFADFLNEVKVSLTVTDGVVKDKDEIWFYLGKGTEPFEQIIYEHGRFHLRDTKYAAYPVVRVTWYAASTYARHYDKRLVTESEWDYLLSKKSLLADIHKDNQTHASSKASEDAPTGNEEHTHMMQMEPSSGNSEASVHTRRSISQSNGLPTAKSILTKGVKTEDSRISPTQVLLPANRLNKGPSLIPSDIPGKRSPMSAFDAPRL